MSFDMSLARGLDYYTGIIYEAITELSAPPSIPATPSVPPQAGISSSVPSSSKSKSKSKDAKPAKDGEDVDESSVGVGSIAAGGRYDNLVGMFAGDVNHKVPCVGISFGLERLYSIMEMKRKKDANSKIRGKETEVYVMNFGKEGLLKERIGFAKLLRDNGIKVGPSIAHTRPLADKCRPSSCSKRTPRTEPSSVRLILIKFPSLPSSRQRSWRPAP
jgi:histidyl-tRNA synthetase